MHKVWTTYGVSALLVLIAGCVSFQDTSPGPAPVPCLNDSDCPYDACSPTSHTCNPYGCVVDTDCTSGLCESEFCEFRRDDGQPCQRDAECASGMCSRPAGVCASQSGLEPCVTDADCAGGTWCDSYARVCRSSLADGIPCSQDQACSSGVCRGIGSGFALCGQPEPNGGLCSRDVECAQHDCNGVRCGAPDGAPCTKADACGSRLCVDGLCGAQPNGRACTGDPDCQSGFCDAGSCEDKLPSGAACTGGDGCLSSLCTGGICSCVGPESGPGAVATRCCSGHVWIDDNLNRWCVSSLGMPCAANAQCDPGQACGSAGACCVASGIAPWLPVGTDRPSDCCSGAVSSNGLCQ